MKRLMPRGFTLLEILIATGTFMIVMVVAVGIFTLNVGSSSVTEQMRINAQSARFAFESISREIRLAHGIVYADDTTSKVVIPPFDVTQTTNIIRIYQATKVGEDAATGQPQYSLSRRLYCLKDMPGYTAQGKKQLVIMTQKAYESSNSAPNGPKTAKELFGLVGKQTIPGTPDGVDILPWTPGTASCKADSSAPIEPVTPKDLETEQWRIVRSYDYKDAMTNLSNLKVQPFIEIDMTVSNPRYNLNRDENQQIKTTLRTMIVPRNFISPFDIGQVGVPGATQ